MEITAGNFSTKAKDSGEYRSYLALGEVNLANTRYNRFKSIYYNVSRYFG